MPRKRQSEYLAFMRQATKVKHCRKDVRVRQLSVDLIEKEMAEMRERLRAARAELKTAVDACDDAERVLEGIARNKTEFQAWSKQAF